MSFSNKQGTFVTKKTVFYAVTAGIVGCLFLPILFGIFFDREKAKEPIVLDHSNSHYIVKTLHHSGLLKPPYTHHGPVGTLTLQRRRSNSACILVNNDKHLLNIGGNNIAEIVDVQTGEQLLVANDLVDLNNPSAVHIDDQIWLPCGFGNNKNTFGIAIEDIVIINTKTWEVTRGPKVRVPRGWCATIILKQVTLDKSAMIVAKHEHSFLDQMPQTWQEDVVCMMGGAVSIYKATEFIKDFDCYSRKANAWTMMPELPVADTFFKAHRLQRRTAQGSNDQVVVLDSSGAWGKFDTEAKVYEFSLLKKQWHTVGQSQSHIARGASALIEGRHLAIIGGISMIRTKVHFRKSIELCDVERGSCRDVKRHMQLGRHSMASCQSSDGEVVMVCGGAGQGANYDTGDCEVFEAKSLNE